MLGDWEQKKLVCHKCRNDVKFQVSFKKAQFLNGTHWDDIVKSAEIVLCPHCGASIYIASIKKKAEM